MSLSISNKFIFSQRYSEESLTSSQLEFSFLLQSFCKEAASLSALLGIGVGQTVACLTKAQTFRLLTSISHSRIPLYHRLSSGVGLIAEAVAFPVATELGRSGEFHLGTLPEDLHGMTTIGTCKILGKQLKIGNLFLQHFVQDCALVTVDAGCEKIGLIQARSEGFIVRMAGAEITSMRMEMSAKLLAIICPDLGIIRVKQEASVEIHQSNRPQGSKQFWNPLKEFLSPLLAANNGKTLKQNSLAESKPIVETKDLIYKMEANNPQNKAKPLPPGFGERFRAKVQELKKDNPPFGKQRPPRKQKPFKNLPSEIVLQAQAEIHVIKQPDPEGKKAKAQRRKLALSPESTEKKATPAQTPPTSSVKKQEKLDLSKPAPLAKEREANIVPAGETPSTPVVSIERDPPSSVSQKEEIHEPFVSRRKKEPPSRDTLKFLSESAQENLRRMKRGSQVEKAAACAIEEIWIEWYPEGKALLEAGNTDQTIASYRHAAEQYLSFHPTSREVEAKVTVQCSRVLFGVDRNAPKLELRDLQENLVRSLVGEKRSKDREIAALPTNPTLEEFLRYPEPTRLLVIETWKDFYENEDPRNLRSIAYYKGRAKKFLDKDPRIAEMKDPEKRYRRILEIINIGSLCFQACQEFIPEEIEKAQTAPVQSFISPPDSNPKNAIDILRRAIRLSGKTQTELMKLAHARLDNMFENLEEKPEMRRMTDPETVMRVLSVFQILKIPFDSARFCRELYPSIGQVFPEVLKNPPQIIITPEQFRRAHFFNMGERLLTHRLDSQRADSKKTMAQIAKELGVSAGAILRYEINTIQVYEDHTLMAAIDKILKLESEERQIAYLACRPLLTYFFPVGIREENGAIRPLTREERRKFREKRTFYLNAALLREEVTQALSQKGIRTKEEFAIYLADRGLDPSKADKLIGLSDPLTDREIEEVTSSLDLSYAHWRRHFDLSVDSYFLGIDEKGNIRYPSQEDFKKLDKIPPVPAELISHRYPDTPQWKNLSREEKWHLYITQLILNKYGDAKSAAKKIGLTILQNDSKLRPRIYERTWVSETMALFANMYGLSFEERRLFYIYFRQKTLEKK